MLTRLHVKGFKTLKDVDLRFGAFTCVAGPNAAGKSNIFDAIRLLSALADLSLTEAAASVRDENKGQENYLRQLFYFDGKKHVKEMSFYVEMIIPENGKDDYGQQITANRTFLTYHLTLTHQDRGDSPLRIVKEELSYVKKEETKTRLKFPYDKEWENSVIKGRKSTPFISMQDGKAQRRQDGAGGAAKKYSLETLRRTVLSTCNGEHPTACMARNEMRSWQLLQLEPSAMRDSDGLHAETRISNNGAHLAATAYRLSRLVENDMYVEIANKLSNIIGGVEGVRVDRDEKRELLTLEMKEFSGSWHQARFLSEGTLRFLALTLLEMDADDKNGNVWFLEEPENGIHPQRIKAMLSLLQDIAMDVDMPLADGNPLRQVIINTHSPIVVSESPENSLLLARRDSGRFGDNATRVAAMNDTWRTKFCGYKSITSSQLIGYIPMVKRKKDKDTVARVKDSKTAEYLFREYQEDG